MFSVLTGRTTDMSWPDRGAFSPKGELNIYGEACDGHGGSDVFPFGLLDTDTDGFEVRGNRAALPLCACPTVT